MSNWDKRAFPADPLWPISGLTKREWFAGMAMQSLNRINAINGYNTFEERAVACVQQANALIAELSKDEGK